MIVVQEFRDGEWHIMDRRPSNIVKAYQAVIMAGPTRNGTAIEHRILIRSKGRWYVEWASNAPREVLQIP